MRALSLTQPWAWSMMHGPKFIENRNWNAQYMEGQRFVMHASAKWDPRGEAFLLERGILVPPRGTLPKSCLIGTVDFVRCIPRNEFIAAFELSMLDDDGRRQSPPWMGKARAEVLPPDQEDFFFGEYGFLTANRHPITPIPLPGSLSFFNLTDEVTAEVLRRSGEPVDSLPTPVLAHKTFGWEPPGGLHTPPKKRRGRR